jgi:site-specific DNA recombinase
MKSGALYIRVSTDKQEELSPDAQRRLLLDYAQKNDIVISNEYIFLENGISGKKADKRPQFQKMVGLAKSKEHPIDVILVWKYSRFARNQEESIVYKSLLKKNNVDVISVSEPLIDGPFGSLIERIIEWMDEYYSIRLSGEVTRGMTENALRGKYQARPPLGYRIEHKGCPPVIVDDEAVIVRDIFDQYVNNHLSIYDICKYLNAHGLLTSHGKPFEKRSIEYIIQNPSYMGYIRWNRTCNETNEIKNREEWIITKGEHPPIITEEIFNKAQERFNKEYRPKGARPSSSQKHWLSGLLKCSACGRTLTANHVLDKRYGRTYWNFNCYGYNKAKCMVPNTISERKIVPVIIDSLKKFVLNEEADFSIIAKTTTTNKDMLITELEKLDKKEARIKAAYINGIDSLEEYKSNKALLIADRDKLTKKLNKLEDQIQNKKDIKQLLNQRILDVCQLIQRDDVDYTVKGEAMKSIIEKMVFNKAEDSLDIYVYYS